MRITARLVETSGETHLWIETYERHLTDCLSVQADVAARIARSLALELMPEERHGANATSRDASAYQAYLKARFHWNKPGDEGVDEAIDYYEQSLASDPGFAAAYAGIARAHDSARRVLRRRAAARAGAGAPLGQACAGARAEPLGGAPGARRGQADARVGLARRRVVLLAGHRAQPEP